MTIRCGTTHCRAGWVVALAGEEGAELKSSAEKHSAAALIYIASQWGLTKPPGFSVATRKRLPTSSGGQRDN